jgi:hypothetical protein
VIDLNARAAEEHAAPGAAVEATLPVPMRDPDGRTLIVPADRVEARLAAGYTR